MAMFDWQDGTCSYMAWDCPFDPAMVDAACGLVADFCVSPYTNCIYARAAKSKNHAHHPKLEKSKKKRDLHQDPVLQNQGDPAKDPKTVKCEKAGKSTVTKFRNNGKWFYVELWAYSVTAQDKVGKIQTVIMGVGRQLDDDEKKLSKEDKASAIDVGDSVSFDSAAKFVVQIEYGSMNYQVILTEDP